MPLSNIKDSFSEIIEELKDYIQAKKSLIELKATEKGSPIVAKTIYGAILGVLGLIIANTSFLAIIFAISLIFVTNGTEAFATLSALTFSTLCILAFFALILIILLGIRKRVVRSMEVKFISSYLDKTEEKERSQERQKLLEKKEAAVNKAINTQIKTQSETEVDYE